PDSSKEVWTAGRDWLAPHFLDPGTGIVQCAVQTWLLRSEGRTILVDTGVGNHKERPYSPVWSHLDTGFLADLARAGVRPEDVDIVINTHLHVDHVGWNTYLDGRQWVPT
ncbi:MBL fold metallo-hydrolase, partial [Streptomyces sp. TRM76130]|nr:MBL fold metallo-hydrolase [Streptomyces sp. TRM76130]